MTVLLVVGMLLLVVLVVFWARGQTARIRAKAQQREMEALALLHAGKDPLDAQRARTPAAEVVDLDELLASEPLAAATRARARLEAPTHVDPAEGGATPARPLNGANGHVARAAKPVQQQAAPAQPTSPAGTDVPLRELALAWFEARGYRGSPASAIVRPIELVLRHKGDPARAYAFVVEHEKLSSGRIDALVEQARSIGLMRLLIAAEGGADDQAAHGARRKGVRVMDRTALEGEFRKLDLSVAAKIIAVARKRATLH
jgi:hypothetical protein